MKKNILGIYILLICQLSYCQNNIDSLITNLQTEFYSTMKPAQESLERIGKESIPKLIELLRDTTHVQLENTVDLIYPGAIEFYGHGNIIPYNINFISIRAGWVLEKITFRDFGYLSEKDVEDYNEDSATIAEINKNRNRLAKQVEIWWTKNKNKWNRLEALKNALKSDNDNERFLAIIFLQQREKQFPELTEEILKKEIEPLLKKFDEDNEDE